MRANRPLTLPSIITIAMPLTHSVRMASRSPAKTDLGTRVVCRVSHTTEINYGLSARLLRAVRGKGGLPSLTALVTQLSPRLSFCAAPTANGSYVHMDDGPVSIGSNVALLFDKEWYTSATNEWRCQAFYQVRDQSGNIVKDTTAFASVLPDSVDESDQWDITSTLADKEDRLWLSLWRSSSNDEHYYIILNSDGSVYKALTQTSSDRCFMYCDQDGYIWATENGQVLILRPNDTSAVAPRPVAFAPNWINSSLPAQVDGDGYRMYDRWSPQVLQVDVPEGITHSTMRLVDLNMWNNSLHASDVIIKKGSTTVWSQQGSLAGSTTIDASAYLTQGSNVLTMAQDDLQGGQLLVTFDDVPAILSVTPASQAVGGDAGATSVSVANAGGGTMSWNARVSESSSGWLHIVSGASGTNSGIINISYDANGSPTGRTGAIIIEAPGATDSPQNVTVTQEAASDNPPEVTHLTGPAFAYEGWTVRLVCVANDPDAGDYLQNVSSVQTGGKHVAVNWPQSLETIVPITIRGTYLVPSLTLAADGHMTFDVTVTDQRGGLSSPAASITINAYMAGDSNHDDYVNIGDLQTLVAVWGSNNSGQWWNWNPWADFNNDSYVNVGDLQTLVANWGRRLVY